MSLFPDPASYPDKRLFALDFLRGADMLVLVAWCAIGRAIGRAYGLGPGWMGQFQHPWIGFTLWDFIQPLFMFVVGAAVPLALAKRLTDEGKAGWGYWKHVLSRIAMLWLLGGVVQCNWLTLDPLRMTPYGNALQTIAVGYFLSALIYPIRRTWLRFTIVLAGVAAYEIPLHLAGDYTMYGNWAVRFDTAIWRVILPEGNVFLDTQGWTRFSTTPVFLFLCACGMESTRLLLRRDWSSWKKAGVLFAVGLAMCLFGLLLWKVVGIPLIKHIFSASFAFLAQGLCLLSLAATYVVTDIWKFRRGTGLVLLWGQCALFAYFMSHVFAMSYVSITERCLQGLPRLVSDARLVSVLNAVGSMAVLTLFMVVWRQFRAARKR